MPPKNYSNITVRREIREELEKLRGELKVKDFSDLLALLVAKYREYTSVTSKLVEQLTSISSKVDELLTRVSSSTTSVSSISASGKAPATSTSSSSKTKQEKPKGHVWCRKKSEIRNLEGFLNWVERAYGLVDWWDEEDKYCFETTMPP